MKDLKNGVQYTQTILHCHESRGTKKYVWDSCNCLEAIVRYPWKSVNTKKPSRLISPCTTQQNLNREKYFTKQLAIKLCVGDSFPSVVLDDHIDDDMSEEERDLGSLLLLRRHFGQGIVIKPPRKRSTWMWLIQHDLDAAPPSNCGCFYKS